VSRRLNSAWLVFTSIENEQHDRCVDIFYRRDDSFGFAEFRRDPEDRGEWTPVTDYSAAVFATSKEALAAAERTIGWLPAILLNNEALRRLPR
jgi:hypothetical protein